VRLCSNVEPTARYLTPRASARKFSRLLVGSGGPSSRCNLRRKSCVRMSRGSAFASFNSTRQTAALDGNAEKNASSLAASNAREKSSSNTHSEYYDSNVKMDAQRPASLGQNVFLVDESRLEISNGPSSFERRGRQFLKSFERVRFERWQYYCNVIVTE